MKDVLKHLTVGDRDYPFAFNINVIQAIVERYGGLNEWSNLIMPEDKETMPDLSALKYFCKEAINEGIDMENDPEDIHYKRLPMPRPFITEKQAARIISAAENFNKFAMQAVAESNDTGKGSDDDQDDAGGFNGDEKNVMTGQIVTQIE